MDIKKFLTEKGLDPELAGKHCLLAELLLDWNEKINITAIRGEEEFMQKNVMDSLALCGNAALSAASEIIDVGTGGGFPGLPLAIAYPEKRFMLIDSVGKKLRVIEDVTAKLGLLNVKTAHGRAEALARKPEFRDSFDLALSRAVANMSSLSEYCLPFVKQGGFFIAYKTEAAQAEIEEAFGAVKKLGGKMNHFVSDGIPGSGHGFVIIEKLTPTPAAYPRKAGIPAKNPLR